MISKIFKFISGHKILAVIIILACVFGGYYIYKTINKNKVQITYALAAVSKGALITTVSGTGQVIADSQIDLKPKASGEVIDVPVIEGQAVTAGTIIVQLDSTDAQKTLRDAQLNLQSAQLTLQKALNPATPSDLLSAQNALKQAQDNLTKLKLTQSAAGQNLTETKQKDESNLKTATDNGFNTVTNVFLDLPNIMAGLNDIINGNTLNASQANVDYYTDLVKTIDDKVLQYKSDTTTSYQTARTKYDKAFNDYKIASRYSDPNTLESLINETYDTAKSVAEAIKNTNNLIQFVIDKITGTNIKAPSLATTHLNGLGTYTGKLNTHLINLLSILQTITDDKQALTNTNRDIDTAVKINALDLAAAEQSIAEKQAQLDKLQAGTEPIDIAAQRISLAQRENAVTDAAQKIDDYTVRAPVDGVVAGIKVKKYDSASSGTAVASIVTSKRVVQISLNEVDVTKIKNGMKATVTFSAIDKLSISGEVAQIDTLGTVSQGVVSFNVKIVFDTQDDRVKPGMSASATIITEAKQDVLIVPNAAVKTSTTGKYVEMPDETISQADMKNISKGITLKNPLKSVTVEVGSANDTATEITSGLNEGDLVVTKTNNSAKTTTTTQGQSLFGGGGVGIPGR